MPAPPSTEEPAGRAVARGPGKAMRIEAMTGELLEELRAAPLDDASRMRMAAIHDQTVRELADALPEAMRVELARLVTEFGTSRPPSDGELRVAEAQLLGWLSGVVAAAESAMVLRAGRAGEQMAPPGPDGAPVGYL